MSVQQFATTLCTRLAISNVVQNSVIRSLCFFCSVMFSCICLAANAQDADREILVVHDHFPPATINPSVGESRIGFSNELIRDIFTEAGYTITFQTASVARAHEMLRTGEAQLLSESSPLIVPQFLFPDEPTFRHINVFWVRQADHWTYDGFSSLQGRQIGTVIGYDFEIVDEDFHAYLQDEDADVLRIGGVDAIERLLRMLALGRIDTINESELVVGYFLPRLGLSGSIRAAGIARRPAVYWPAFSAVDPRSQELMQVWDTGRIRFAESGRDAALLEAYGIDVEVALDGLFNEAD